MITVRVHADGLAEVGVGETPRHLTLTAEDAFELFEALDAEVDRCYRCNEPVFLEIVGVCDPFGAYCDGCGHGSYRGCQCEVAA